MVIKAEREVRRLADENCRQLGCPADITHVVCCEEAVVHDLPEGKVIQPLDGIVIEFACGDHIG